MPSVLTNNGIKFPDNTEQNTALPFNTIAFWSGLISSIPSGWQLCDGTNGTPDLRDKFVVGAGSSYTIGNTGGQVSVSLTSPELPAHNHPVTSTSINPSSTHSHGSPGTGTEDNHRHTVSALTNAGASIYTSGGGALQLTPSTGPAGSHSHPAAVGAAGAHTHVITISAGESGSGSAHENRPPYYALAFIMEVA